jgi:hypothetical protein
MDTYKIEIGGEVIDLAAKGKAQLSRLAKVSQFINLYGTSVIKDMNFGGMNENAATDMVVVITKFIGSLEQDGLVLLGEIVSGKDAVFVEENFDLEWVIDGVTMLLETPAFRKLVERFFGSQG